MSMELPSVCPLDCPDTCSLTVTVEEDRVVKVRGSHVNPITEGAICNKVARSFPEFVHGENRLTHPLARTGARGSGQFERISWDQALDRVYKGFTKAIDQYGPQSVVPFNYAGPHGFLAGGSIDYRFFNKLGATRLDRGPLCGGVKSIAHESLFGTMPGTPMEQARHSKLIVVWGNNVTVSNLHLSSIIKDARRQGAKLVVVDPKRIKIAEQANLVIQLRPGTDVVLAWAMAAELERLGAVDHAFVDKWVLGFDAFMDRARRMTIDQAADICGIAAEDIRTLAGMFAAQSPAAIAIGNGMERNRNGGACMRAAMALAAITGQFGTKGSGVIAKAGYAFPKTTARLQRPDLLEGDTRTLNIIDMAKHILDDGLDPPIKALMIYNHNPIGVHPDQNRMKRALAREDLFIAGCDVAMTDSMLYADVILPAASHFEYADLYAAYGQQYLQRAGAVIPPVGEALPNTEIFRCLAKRFGFDDPAFTASDAELMDDALDRDDPRVKGIQPSQLATDSALRMEFEGEEAIPFVNVFPTTPSGKIELYSEALEDKYGQGLPDYKPLDAGPPLIIVTPSSDKRTNATFGGTSQSDGMEILEMHPDDAARRGLEDGMTVRVWNDLGEVALALKISQSVRPGVVYSPKGTWLRTSSTGQTTAALIAVDKADIGEGACYNDTRVDVAAFADA